MNAIALIEPAAEIAPLFDVWLATGRELLTARNDIEWRLADWVAEGREQFGNQAAFDFLADNLGIAPDRLKAAAKVATVFPAHLRDTSLTFDHHESVAGLPTPEALTLLKRAKDEHLDDRETRIEAVRLRAELAPSLLSENDWKQVQITAMARAWNRAGHEARQEFTDMIEESNGGPIDA